MGCKYSKGPNHVVQPKGLFSEIEVNPPEGIIPLERINKLSQVLNFFSDIRKPVEDLLKDTTKVNSLEFKSTLATETRQNILKKFAALKPLSPLNGQDIQTIQVDEHPVNYFNLTLCVIEHEIEHHIFKEGNTDKLRVLFFLKMLKTLLFKLTEIVKPTFREAFITELKTQNHQRKIMLLLTIFAILMITSDMEDIYQLLQGILDSIASYNEVDIQNEERLRQATDLIRSLIGRQDANSMLLKCFDVAMRSVQNFPSDSSEDAYFNTPLTPARVQELKEEIPKLIPERVILLPTSMNDDGLTLMSLDICINSWMFSELAVLGQLMVVLLHEMIHKARRSTSERLPYYNRTPEMIGPIGTGQKMGNFLETRVFGNKLNLRDTQLEISVIEDLTKWKNGTITIPMDTLQANVGQESSHQGRQRVRRELRCGMVRLNIDPPAKISPFNQDKQF